MRDATRAVLDRADGGRAGDRVTGGSVSAPASLVTARELVEPVLRGAVDRLAPRIRQVAGYHLGWWEQDGAPVAASGGKAVRATLALLSARAVGAPASVGVPGAVAVELVHNFSLLHDDLMDGDRERRHRPTVWAVYGAADAILAGDALMVLADQVLLAVGGQPSIAALRALNNATQQLITGQTDDLAFERRMDVRVDEVIAMEAGKTGALLACAATIGALLAGADDDVVAALDRFGAELGIAFQLVDDVLGIWGRPEVTGKPVLADIRARKNSVPVVAALRSGSPSAARLAELYRTEGWRDDEEIALAASLVDEAGGRAWTLAEAHRRLELALQALDAAAVEPHAKADLVELARFVTSREL